MKNTTIENSAYKLKAVATLLDSPERTKELDIEVFSGIRIILEEIAEQLINEVV